MYGKGITFIGMKKINIRDLKEETWKSPKGKFGVAYQGVSEALGRKPNSTDLSERHPFDLEICRIPAGKVAYPYHMHSAQWELYHVVAGGGKMRHGDGITSIEQGDSFIFGPGEAHQMINDTGEDLIVYVIADNPMNESGYYPDSKKWIVRTPERRLIRSEGLDYLDGEE